jgi:hypothetical protein
LDPEIVTSRAELELTPGANSLTVLLALLTTYTRPVVSTATPLGAESLLPWASLNSGATLPVGLSA